jgi:hypothetical protein
MMFHALRGWLSRWAVRMGALPQGVHVDPEAFPEETYPVHCLQCGYALRGLPDGRCPECGEAFERGHLLVELYARGRLPGPRGRTIRRLQNVASGIGALFPLSLLACGLALAWDQERTARFLARTSPVLLCSPLIAVVCGMVAGWVIMIVEITLLPPRNRRQTVRDAARRRARETLAPPLAGQE